MGRSFLQLTPLISILFLILTVGMIAPQVNAVGKPEGVGNENKAQGKAVGKVMQDALTKQSENSSTDAAKGRGKGKVLEGIKLQACEGKSQAIVTRSTQLNQRVIHMEEVFDSIARGMQNHYQTHLLPSGKTLATYDTLVAAIQTQKDAMTPLLEKLQTDVTNFSCTGDDPAGQLTQYRTDMQAVTAGLQAYKRAVRNLIVGIATIQGKSDKSTPSTTGSLSPTPTGGSTTVTPTVPVSPTEVPSSTPTP